MTDRPSPERRYQDARQDFYELGWHQMQRDAPSLIERFGDFDAVPLAAALEGAADLLLELADRQHDIEAMIVANVRRGDEA